jgi:Na+-translocating ferredoxin:NAD+ oxidoreductase RnfC subunit
MCHPPVTVKKPNQVAIVVKDVLDLKGVRTAIKDVSPLTGLFGLIKALKKRR